MDQQLTSKSLKEEYVAMYWRHKKEIELLKAQHKAKVDKLENQLNKKAYIASTKSRKARSRFLIKFGAEMLACFGVRFKEVDFLKSESELYIIGEEIKQSVLGQIRKGHLYYYGRNDK